MKLHVRVLHVFGAAAVVTTLLTLAAPSPAAAAPTAAADICVGPPAPNDVILFIHKGFSGRCAFRTVGEYRNSGAFEIGNDALSSIWIGDNVHVQMCRDSNFLGVCEWLDFTDNRLSDNDVGNDTVSSLRVRPKGDFSRPAACVPGYSQVAFYVDTWFSGSCAILSVSGTRLFPHSDDLSLPNDSISSFRTGKGIASVKLCRDAEYSATGGGCMTFDAAAMDLTYGVPVLSAHFINDQTSSAVLRQKTSAVGSPIVFP